MLTLDVLFAITDIETTGGHPSANSITEISVLLHDGKQVLDRFETLINPGRPIPFSISQLTGITDDMLVEAPRFEDIAAELHSFLEEAIFVAHNVNFDYSFIKEALSQHGFSWNASKLCTVRLSRKLFPGLSSYSLGGICRELGIRNPNPHRAGGDTEATAELFRRLLEKDQSGVIEKSLKRGDEDSFLPAGVPKEDFRKLPDAPGVYYFHGAGSELLYIGKARNIRQRVRSHFSGTFLSARRQELSRGVRGISFEATGTELIALLLEDDEIRKHWPPLNQAQKHKSGTYGVFNYTDGLGRLRLGVQKNGSSGGAIRKFDSASSAREWMMAFCLEHMIPLTCCGIEDSFDPYHGEEHWNDKLQSALIQLKSALPSFILPGAGRVAGEQSFVFVEEGMPAGYGYLPSNEMIRSREDLENWMKPLKGSALTRSILESYLDKNKPLIIPF